MQLKLSGNYSVKKDLPFAFLTLITKEELAEEFSSCGKFSSMEWDEIRDALSRPFPKIRSTLSDGRVTLTPYMKSEVCGTYTIKSDGKTDCKVGKKFDRTYLSPCGSLSDLPPPLGEIPLVTMTKNKKDRWRIRSGFGGYALTAPLRLKEWIRFMLVSEADLLRRLGIYESVLLALFEYRHPDEVLMAFASRWCHVTNTAILDDREMTPTLLEISRLSGLPINGETYIERELAIEAVLGRAAQEGACPPELIEVYMAYVGLCDHGSSVSLDAWVAHFADMVFPYGSRFASPDDPFGDGLPIHARRVPPSVPICSRGYSRGALRLAFISSWLCYFVVPGDRPGFIRLSVFELAYKMAVEEKRHSLAIPALGYIYTSLRMLTTSGDVSRSAHQSPLHFLSGWLYLYFPILYTGGVPAVVAAGFPVLYRLAGAYPTRVSYSEAQCWFRDMVKNVDYLFARSFFRIYGVEAIEIEDTIDGRLMEVNSDAYEFMVSIRCGFLSFRFGDRYVLEAYMPMRCPWQHGYDQASLACLDPISIKGLRVEHFEAFARLFLVSGTGVVFIVPERDHVPCFQFFYLKRHVTSFGTNRQTLREVVADSMSWDRDRERPDKAHTILTSTTMPLGFLGWDSYYNKNQSGDDIPSIWDPPKVLEAPRSEWFSPDAVSDEHIDAIQMSSRDCTPVHVGSQVHVQDVRLSETSHLEKAPSSSRTVIPASARIKKSVSALRRQRRKAVQRFHAMGGHSTRGEP